MLAQRGFYSWMSDEAFLRMLYRARMKRELNLEQPRTFNEKLQWLKIHDRRPEYRKMVDKYDAREYIAGRIGDQYLVPVYGVWDSFRDIDFDLLPSRFVLKCTHDSGGVVICRDRKHFNPACARAMLSSRMRWDYYWVSREWPYRNLKPRVLAEKYLTDESGYELKDYKLMCFNGQVRCSFVCSDRMSSDGLKVTFYDREWKRLPFTRHYPAAAADAARPAHYEEMIRIAEILSENIPFLRVDFYEADGRLYVGELTFYPGGGMEEFTPQSWDYELGSWLELPDLD